MRSFVPFLVCLGMLHGCTPAPQSAAGFRLPDGDADRGQEAFVALQCHACHMVEGLDAEFVGTGAAMVPLGGEVSRVRSYGELVTSVINPSHRLAEGFSREEISTAGGESLMALAYLNEAMTVQELIDLVAFLQSRYELRIPDINPYDYIYQ